MKIKGYVEEIDRKEGYYGLVMINDFRNIRAPKGMSIPKDAFLDDFRVGMPVIVNISVGLDTDKLGNNQNEKN